MDFSFKNWLESIFGQPVDQAEPIPSSEFPVALNNGAFPTYDPKEPKYPPGRKLKKQKKN